MALPILDGNQSATTLSTILSSGQHIPAHTVVSLGTQAITDITSAVSGTSVCVGSISISGTPSVTGSVSVLNFPASQSTTFGAVTGSVSVLNFPASQAVTFSAVTISNFPSTQTIAGTVTANLSSSNLNSVTIGVRGSVTANSNLTATALLDLVEPVRAGVFQWADSELQGIISNSTPVISGTVTASALKLQTGDNVFNYLSGEEIQEYSSGNPVVAVYASLPNALPAGTNRIGVVTIGAGTVTIGAGTAQIGSVTASVSGTVTVGGFSSVSVGSGALLAGGLRGAGVVPLSMDVGTGYLQTKVESLPALVAGTAQIGSVTASISNSVTIGFLPAISGTVTANVLGYDAYNDFYPSLPIGRADDGIAGADNAVKVAIATELGGVNNSNPLPISGTVTANSSNGSLTTRFGSVVTANTAFATSAVTNTNRKYLLIQNITTASNVITVGIGFTPTTTQGIQLFAGAGLTFEGTYIPTGAVNLLSSVTASCYTILEA